MGATHFSGPVVSADGFEGAAVSGLAAAGITDAATIAFDITKTGKVISTQVFIDIAGLASSTTDLDIIGTGTSAAYLLRIDNATMGQIFALTMTCLEAPVTGVTDIDLYVATEGTGAFDDGIAALTETAIVTSGAAWTLNRVATATGWPLDDKYLYLTGGAAGTADTYSAGQFLIEMWGYEA